MGLWSLSFAFKESGDIEEIEVEYAGRHAGLWGEFVLRLLNSDYESNNIDISFDPKSNTVKSKKRNYGKIILMECQAPISKIQLIFMVRHFEVKYADKSIQHIESISTYIVDLDLINIG